MAKEKKHEGKDAKKKHLHAITTHKAEDGTAVHEHHYRDEEGKESSSFGGVSTNLDDLQQHMADHMGDHFQDQQQQPDPAAGGDGGAGGGGAAPPVQAQ